MSRAKCGDRVRVNYAGKLEDGRIFDSTIDQSPFEFTIGESDLIAGFEEAVVGMVVGESKTERIPPDKAFGPHRDSALLRIERCKFPAGLEPEVGEIYQICTKEDAPAVFTVAEVCESCVIVDMNYPLAGKHLFFDLQLVEIL